ncbi:hypothetical protein [Hymenobacter sp.]|uniref:hypothetical protein n=1 Tax=Hymenobacter sp. TaxID=1898978 RepID=UPI00286C5A0B|nr:hypothetical protein [Hymenobacter sp.]
MVPPLAKTARAASGASVSGVRAGAFSTPAFPYYTWWASATRTSKSEMQLGQTVMGATT